MPKTLTVVWIKFPDKMAILFQLLIDILLQEYVDILLQEFALEQLMISAL